MYVPIRLRSIDYVSSIGLKCKYGVQVNVLILVGVRSVRTAAVALVVYVVRCRATGSLTTAPPLSLATGRHDVHQRLPVRRIRTSGFTSIAMLHLLAYSLFSAY